MRYVFSLLALLFFIPMKADAQQWHRASYSPDGQATFYIDLDSIRTSGIYRQAWIMLSLRNPDREMKSLRQLMVFNCAQSQFRVDENECYTGSMGTGRRCGGGKLIENWKSAPPSSSYGILTNAICQ